MTPEITGYAYRLLTLAQKGPHGMSLLVGQAGVFRACPEWRLVKLLFGKLSDVGFPEK